MATSGALQGATFSIGAERYHVDVCRSGDLEYFLGVDLEDQARGAVVRLFIDPMYGPRLRVIHGTGESREIAILGRSQCRELEADLRTTGWRVNTVRDFSGSLDAECKSDAGHDVSVHVRFEHCH
jgi:hypothetical protein